MSTTKIGKVKLTFFKKKDEAYSDQSEDFLLNFFDRPQSQKENEIIEVLINNPSWPILYHLSPQRNFLLDWYPFKKNSAFLEIGAGCGAVTGLFLRKVKKVYANELTKIRAEIIAKRYTDYSNLEIIGGNITNYNFKNKFDYITLIGVLEYSGIYISRGSNKFLDPFITLLRDVKTFLKNNGHLLIAIENKLGLKYLSGGREDHYGNLFSSIENYPQYDGIRTFSKQEITSVLQKSGFSEIKFFYPFPDYKLPFTILTDDGFNLNFSKSSYSQIVDLSNERIPLFNETIFSQNLHQENILANFANSFLIDCQI